MKDVKTFDNISATTDQFQLLGGTYGIVINGATEGVVSLQKLGQDELTWVTVVHLENSNLAGYTTEILMPGGYRFFLSGSSGVYVALARVP